jgi:hypothetical protein
MLQTGQRISSADQHQELLIGRGLDTQLRRLGRS